MSVLDGATIVAGVVGPDVWWVVRDKSINSESTLGVVGERGEGV